MSCDTLQEEYLQLRRIYTKFYIAGGIVLYCGDLGISRFPIAKLSIASELPVRRRYLRAHIREKVKLTMTYEITKIYDDYKNYFDDYVTMVITSTTTMMS